MARLPALRTRLLWLAAASVLPVLVLAWWLALVLVKQEREAFRDAAGDRAGALLSAIDAKVRGHVATLQAVAASPALQAGDLAAFHAETRRVLRTQPDWQNLMLVDATGQQLTNTRVPPGAPLPRALDEELPLVERAVRTGAPVVGQISNGPLTGRPGIALRLPVQRADGSTVLLQAILKPQSLLPLLDEQRFPQGWIAGLVDPQDRFIARVPPAPHGGTISQDFAQARRQAADGWYRGATLEGLDSYMAYRTSAFTGWTVGIAIPAPQVHAAALRVGLWLAGGALCSLLLALGIAAVLGRRTAAPIAQLAALGRLLGREPVGQRLDALDQRAGVAEVQDVAAALAEAERGLAERESLREREQDALRAADRAKDEFLAMLGHELRNPLSAITASAHVLRLSRPGAGATQGAHEVIDRQARQMTRLVEDLLDVSRLAMGKVRLQTERMDLAALAGRVVQTWEQSGRTAPGRLRLDATPAWVDGDRVRLEQVLVNLLDNAARFAGDQPIDITVRPEGGQAVLAVRDHGQGIPPQDLERIFELFVQGPQAFHRPQGGLGLGLALVRRLVGLQGGSIVAASDGPGQGACFTVRLPLVEAAGAAGEEGDGGAPAACRRVLLVEDDDDGRAMLQALLELQGHRVRSCGRGLEAVALAGSWRPDVVLVDIGLPDIDGMDVARRIRALGLVPVPVLVAVSGYALPQAQQAAYEAGFDLHLAKPIAPEFLRDVLQALTTRVAEPAAAR